ncbi:MAG: outer membrane protein assembly factor BamD [Saprospiraceae bacterium]|nr:outer membrane protein assembly factor BamD [Saprospiraceae bacterium]MCF8251864.1 outer membrane protein assembly factor BamD [Saprospiraceae bacterium]MCF8283079.1 outer membrane protein assembly factor BamD [Bacteroidales bacterium]MCF8313541.1 outer membrane protein assembly factor BamD [Saprospiraceae bacterium]MCF8442612.1 outer membrane protein assembly factor BamD [Saprospiraceae bacterium]
MKKRLVQLLFLSAFALLSVNCKSEYEKIRGSGDTDKMFAKAFEYYEQQEYLRAQTLLELIIPAYRGKPELEKVYFTYADTYYKLGKYIMANYYFKNFASTFPHSAQREDADFMAAYSNYQMSPGFRLEQTYTIKAIDELQLFVNTYPNSPRLQECNKLIDQMRLKLEKKNYEEGILYFNLRQYQAATTTLENLLKDFPETSNAEQVRYHIAKANYLLAENSIFEKQEERYKSTIAYTKDYLEKFKGNDNYNEVKSFYNNSVKKLKSITNGRYQDQSAGAGR